MNQEQYLKMASWATSLNEGSEVKPEVTEASDSTLDPKFKHDFDKITQDIKDYKLKVKVSIDDAGEPYVITKNGLLVYWDEKIHAYQVTATKLDLFFK